jgi:hypothetical protein
MLPAVTAISSGNFEIGDRTDLQPPTARAASVGAPDASRESVDGFDCANTGAGAIATPTIANRSALRR